MDSPSQPVTPSTSDVAEDNTVAFVSYLTFIGFIVAIIMHSNKKTQLGAFHLRQTLGLVVTAVAVWIASFVLAFIPILGWLTIFCLWIALLACWIMGFISALNRQMKPLPVVGPLYQRWFASAFA